MDSPSDTEPDPQRLTPTRRPKSQRCDSQALLPRGRYMGMLRPACRRTIDELLVAAHRGDRDLDLALLRVGVLAPADLEQIKTVLTTQGVSLRAAANADGHCVIEVWRTGAAFAHLLHNGEVDLFATVAAA